MLKRLRQPGVLPIGALLVILFVALHLMSDAVQGSKALSSAFVPLLAVVLLGLVVLAALVVVNVVKLVRRHRRQAVGSRLTARIVVLFALISLLPVGVVYYYSLGFLLHGIDSWFDVEVDRAMEDALTLNRASLDLNQRLFLKYSQQLLSGIKDRSTTALALTLDELRRRSGALELTMFGGLGEVEGTSSEDPTRLVPDYPDREVFLQARSGTGYVGPETRPSGELVVRVVVADLLERRFLQAIFPTSERLGELSARLEDAYNRYAELSYLRRALKLSFSLTLSLVLLLGLLAALTAAFHTARRLVAPVADLARGTQAIAAGDYAQQLPEPRHDDELALLVISFNTMARRIAQARDAAARSAQAVEAQRAYLETVLGRLSSGVVALDAEGRLRTANPAAMQILRLPAEGDDKPALAALAQAHPRLRPWVEAVAQHLDGGQDWRSELTLIGGDGRQVLMCRGSPLRESQDEERGHVVVFDDITTLIMAQREAAWAEVARRLAHEIKNPLTPIQLSSERLRHKLLAKLAEQDAAIVDRATRTIIQQVEAMKAMVNDFSNYARAPQMAETPLELDALVADVLDLYRGGGAAELITHLDAPGVRINGDPMRLRQLLHNLVKNAQEALEGREHREIRVSTARVADPRGPQVELVVADNGGGFDEALLPRVFEPYVTSKAKGTGLGLAIVKKIVEEHGGAISAESAGGGARVVARLPVWQGAG